MKNIFIFCNLLLWTTFLFAQEEKIVLTMYLKNGDVLSGKSEIVEVDLKTNYGTLAIPLRDINIVNIGLESSNFDKSRLLNLLEIIDFGAKDLKETAFDEITQMNEATIPFIKSYLESGKTPNSNENDINVEILYEVMLTKYKVTRSFKLYDEIIYNDKNSIEGTWAFENILLQTDYGRVKIPRAAIESIAIKTATPEGFAKENSFKVFANKHVLGNQKEAWLNTGILVKKGEEIHIKTNGTISLASLSGNKYTADGGVNGSAAPQNTGLNYGNLIFKISEKGASQNARDEIKTTADKTGIIYISIYETIFNSGNLGFYNANVLVK